MRIHVLGIGSIGSLFAFHLRRALPTTTPISLIVRKRRVVGTIDERENSIRVERDGITDVSGPFEPEIWDVSSQRLWSLMYDRRGQLKQTGEPPSDPYAGLEIPGMKQRRVPKWRQPEVGQAHPIESLILTCKAPSTLSALQRLVPRLSSNSTIVLLQNGMGVYEQLVERLFPDPEKRPHFVLASTSHGVWARGPLNVVHAGLGDFSFGIVPDPQKRRDYEASLKSGFSHLQLADISTNPAEDPQSRTLHATIHALLSLKDLNPHWESMPNMHLKLLRKLCVNCCVNPLTAIMNVTNGELLGSTEAYSILRAICKEASAVFRAHSESGDSYLPATLAMAHLTSPKLEEETMRVIGHTSRNFSSMQQDIKNGKIPTEIEYMNGYLCRLGQQYDVPTPANNMMRQMVKFKSSVGKPTPLPPVMKYWHPLGSFDLGQRERQQTTTKDSTQFRRGSVL